MSIKNLTVRSTSSAVNGEYDPIPTYLVVKYTKEHVGPFGCVGDARDWVRNNDEYGAVTESVRYIHATQNLSIREKAVEPTRFHRKVNDRNFMKRARRHKRHTLVSENERKARSLQDLRLV